MKFLSYYFAIEFRLDGCAFWTVDKTSIDDDRGRVEDEIERRQRNYPDHEYRLVKTACEWKKTKTSDELRKARAAAVRKMFPRRSRS